LGTVSSLPADRIDGGFRAGGGAREGRTLRGRALRDHCAIGARCCLKPPALAGLVERRSERGTPMRPWLLIFGTGLASIGLQAAQAQVTIDITEITCNQFLGSQITDSRTLGIWLNGYVNGERGKRLIHPPFPRTHQFGELLREPHGHADFGCCPKRFWCRQVVIWHS
jgi:hypothetical protein